MMSYKPFLGRYAEISDNAPQNPAIDYNKDLDIGIQGP